MLMDKSYGREIFRYYIGNFQEKFSVSYTMRYLKGSFFRLLILAFQFHEFVRTVLQGLKVKNYFE